MFEAARPARRALHGGAAAAAILGATALVVLDRSAAYAASTVTINGSSVLQPIDGFGFSEAFGRTSVIRGMSAQNQQQLLDLLFSRTNGIGSSIVRLGISSTSSSIQPTNPGGPNATPATSGTVTTTVRYGSPSRPSRTGCPASTPTRGARRRT
jgi:glucosylceramidase